MGSEIKVALIGLDTSHTNQFAMRMQAPDCPPEQKVDGLKAVNCLRFSTPFISEKELDERQRQLESWGVRVTTDFNQAATGCDVLMLEINDPAYHLDYFRRCAELGKPMFLDKPLAENIANGKAIYQIARDKKVRVFSSSSLRYLPQLTETCRQMPDPLFVHTYGPLGEAPAGSSIVWYGVHTFEMLERAIGRGATSVFTKKDASGVTCIVGYPDDRRGIVELSTGAWIYGGCLRQKDKTLPFVADTSRLYADLLIRIRDFFKTGQAPVALEDTLEIMGMLDAAQRSSDSGQEEKL